MKTGIWEPKTTNNHIITHAKSPWALTLESLFFFLLGSTN